MGRGTSRVTANTGLEALLGGRAKSGIVRVLATRGSTRLSELVGAVGMSKSAVTSALAQLEGSGAVRSTRLGGREVVVEATERDMLVMLVSFDARMHHHAPQMPVPQEEMDDATLQAIEQFLAEPVSSVARASQSHPSEEGMPVSEDVWKLPRGLPA
jgi:DNA-binding transcriptional ArsR family regulator